MERWTIFEGELGRADVRDLLSLHHAEMRGSSPREACHVLDLDELADPSIRFFSLRDAEDRLLGVGALRDLGHGQGEVKSMRAAPAMRGKGAGRAMLRHIVAVARSYRMTRLSLETGNCALFADAARLYEQEGFIRCGPFGDYQPTPFTHFYTMTL